MAQAENEPSRRRERASAAGAESQTAQDQSQVADAIQRAWSPSEMQPRLEAAYHAYLNYLRAVDEAGMPASVRQACRDAEGACRQTIEEAFQPDQTQRRFEEAYHAYLEASAMPQAWTDEELKQLAEAQKRYMAAIQEAYAPQHVTETWRQALESCQKALQVAWAPDEAQRRFEAAYHAYLTYMRALQEAWLPDQVRKSLESAGSQVR